MMIADMHCDTIMQLWYAKLRGEELHLRDTAGSGQELMLDLTKMKRGGYLLQNFALFCDKGLPADFRGEPYVSFRLHEGEAKTLDLWTQATEMLKVFKEEIVANADLIRQVRTYREIEENAKAGRMSALLTIEESGMLSDDPDWIDILYEEGVRMMTITWNYENGLGFPNRSPEGFQEDFRKFFRFVPEEGNGLTKLGKEVVERMTSLGILADVSHLSDAGFFDVAEIVKGPFVASHSNARAITGCSRNLTDRMIRTIGEHGGVIGLNYCPAFLTEADREEDCRASLEAMVRHAEHIVNVGGREVLGLGSDFDGIEKEGLEIRHAGEMDMLPEALEAHGWTGAEIDGVLSGNVLRVYREVL